MNPNSVLGHSAGDPFMLTTMDVVNWVLVLVVCLFLFQLLQEMLFRQRGKYCTGCGLRDLPRNWSTCEICGMSLGEYVERVTPFERRVSYGFPVVSVLASLAAYHHFERVTFGGPLVVLGFVIVNSCFAQLWLPRRDGRLRTDEYTVKGPASFLVTSTASELDPETQSRFLVLAVDESREATEQILRVQREGETLAGLRRRREGDAIARRHHAVQRLIDPVAVVNPFAPKLRFPTSTLRARRDHKKYLVLIQTIALLHQHQRDKKSIEGRLKFVLPTRIGAAALLDDRPPEAVRAALEGLRG
jgi:hypothetical protein